ncbi:MULTISPECIES: RagB/SusD family nutrient uptake outer membrane protein [Niastella]|uniref:RagB/SusD family nutrient uptake outer membrane protein n=1 Tax=Niastella soli TaxID=2821487 RepID=A0ABS3YU11_9BACT|nr:RagB/SusD family nutrient uptake outer membrane protein [Niastella soli]MBO9201407.1 RagB/SusD family nutrient uptake outer membrane protein [Niastella soli]
MHLNKSIISQWRDVNVNSFVKVVFIGCVSIIQTNCEKLVDIPTPNFAVTGSNVYTEDATAIAVLNGIYLDMSAASKVFSGARSISFYTGLSSDELVLYDVFADESLKKYYQNELVVTGATVAGFETWAPLYNYVFRCNAAIEGLTVSKTLTPSVKEQLLGEAILLRAFVYFYLVNLFGDVPLVLSTDYKVNATLARSPKSQVYQQIIADLNEAKGLLSNNFLNATLQESSNERIRPTKWAAAALLARTYLYTEKYASAEAEATEVINNSTLFTLPELANVFLKNSTEAIWQLQPTDIGYNTQESVTYMLIPNGPIGGAEKGIFLSPRLLSSFESDDQRRLNGNWVDSIIVSGTIYYFPNKYKYNPVFDPSTASTADMKEYLMLLRLGEQLLIRAEARAQQGNISGSQSDLNSIRRRSGLENTTANDITSLLAAILHERQVELFTEFGHRWFDLKRTEYVDTIMNQVTILKGGIWQSTDQLYPLPLSELQHAPNLIQNAGY